MSVHMLKKKKGYKRWVLCRHYCVRGFFWDITGNPDEVTCKSCIKKIIKEGISSSSKWNHGTVDWYVKVPHSKCGYFKPKDSIQCGEGFTKRLAKLNSLPSLCDHPRNHGNVCNRMGCPIEAGVSK